MIPPPAPTTYYGYDANGDLKYVTDALGDAPVAGQPDADHTTRFLYDGPNRQTRVLDALDAEPTDSPYYESLPYATHALSR